MLNLKTLSFALAASAFVLTGLSYGLANAATFNASDIVVAQAGGTGPSGGGASGSGAGTSGMSGSGAGSSAGSGSSSSMGVEECAKITDASDRQRCLERAQSGSGSGGASGSMGTGGGATGSGTGTGSSK